MTSLNDSGKDATTAHLDSTSAPTNVRYSVLVFACSLSMITYLDRACFGAAAASMAKDLGLDGTAQLKWAFTAFTIAYALFEIPAGWFGDRWGPRGTLLRIVAWWSAWTAITGLIGSTIGGYQMGGLAALVVVRFLFGAGEAGAYPNITRAIHNWFPRTYWETAQGFVFMAGRIAGGITPLLWGVLVAGTAWTSPLPHWRWVFAIFGAIGVIWCLAFRLWFRNRPEDHPSVNAAELAIIGPATVTQSHTGGVPWVALLTHPSVWMICIMYALVNYGWIFNITYLPGYMKLRFAIADGDIMGSIYKGAPLWVGAVGCVLGGVLISRLARSVRHRHTARQIVGVSAMLLSAISLWGAVNASGAFSFCALVSLGAFGVDLTLGAIWASCQDIGQKHAAVTAAAMNTIGAIGAAFANWHTGTIVEDAVAASAAELHVTVASMDEAAKTAATLAGYQTVYSYSAIVFVFAAICWIFIRVDRPLVAEE
ncbi:MAG: MFS transporter [Planctomycetaceae bacterium]